MDALKKWMIIDHPFHTIPNHHPTKIIVRTKTVVRIILAAKWLYSSAAFQYVPQTAVTTFAFPSVFIPFSKAGRKQTAIE